MELSPASFVANAVAICSPVSGMTAAWMWQVGAPNRVTGATLFRAQCGNFLDCAKMRQKSSNSEASEATAVSAVGARHALSSGSPAVDHVLRPRRPTATRDGV